MRSQASAEVKEEKKKTGQKKKKKKERLECIKHLRIAFKYSLKCLGKKERDRGVGTKARGKC